MEGRVAILETNKFIHIFMLLDVNNQLGFFIFAREIDFDILFYNFGKYIGRFGINCCIFGLKSAKLLKNHHQHFGTSTQVAVIINLLYIRYIFSLICCTYIFSRDTISPNR